MSKWNHPAFIKICQALEKHGAEDGSDYEVVIMLNRRAGHEMIIKKLDGVLGVSSCRHYGETFGELCEKVVGLIRTRGVDYIAGGRGQVERPLQTSIDFEPGILCGGGAGLLAGWGKREKQS